MFLHKLLRFVPRGTLRRALHHLNRGDFETAALHFEEVLQADTKPANDVAMYACEAYSAWSKQLAHDGHLAAALQALERAAALRPQYADTHWHLAQLYERSDQPQSARLAYERALAINPRYLEARLGLSRLLVHLGDPVQGLQTLQALADHGSEFVAAEVRALVGELRRETPGESQLRQRVYETLDRLVQPPTPVAAALERARQSLQVGDSPAAIIELKALLVAHANFPDVHNLLGVAYDNEEMLDDAIEEFEQALHLNPDYVDARLNLGLALFGRGRDSEAEAHLRDVESRRPNHELVRSVLSEIEARGVVR